MRYTFLAPVAMMAFVMTGCDWNAPRDYSPKADYQAFLQKQADAQKAGAAGTATAVAEVPGKKIFETYCAACHGIDGKADGPSAVALNPRPRNFTDKAWQAKVDDAHIHKVIKEGGTAVGLSATMAPWGAAVTDPEIDDLVKYVRHFGQ